MKFTLQLPGSLPPHGIIGGALLLFFLQLLTGTELFFAEMIFLFVVLAGVAVNVLGGMRTLSGFCVTMIALKIVVVSQCAKVLFGEAADHNLKQPLLTAGVLTVGMASILAAAFAATRIPVRRTLFRPSIEPSYLQSLAWISFGVFLVASPGYLVLGTGDGFVQIGGISGLMKRLMPCGGIAVVAGTAHAILTSGGRRCFSVLNLLPILLMFLLGVYSASKEGMIAPFVYFGLTAIAFRFQARPPHFAALLGFALFLQFALFPFGQVARNSIRGHGFANTLTEIGSFAGEHFGSVEGYKAMHQRSDDGLEESRANFYFDQPIGALERLSLIKPCDALVNATLESGESEWETILPAFESLLPASLYWRPYKNTSNYLGIKSGMIPEENEGTSISFGFIADAFSSFGWRGTVLIPFLLCLLFFTVTRFMAGPMEQNIWWALFCGLYHHQIAELNISGVFTLATYQNLWYIAPAVFVHFAARVFVQCRHWLVAANILPQASMTGSSFRK